MHVSLREHIYAGDDKWFLALAVGGCERGRGIERKRKRGTGKQRAEERTRVLRRCVVTDDPYFQMYYILPVLLSALVCSASSEIPVATACRRSGSRVVEKKKGRRGGGGDAGSESEASDRDYRRREERRKNDSCINTARPGVYIFMCRLAMLGFRRSR